MKHLLLATAAVAVFVVAGSSVYNDWKYGVDDAYAESEGVYAVIGYMKDHQGEWPESWEALRPYCGSAERFVELQRDVFVDFTVNAEDLRRMSLLNDRPAFDVIHGAHNTHTTFDKGPNWLLYEYFRGTRSLRTPADGPLPPSPSE